MEEYPSGCKGAHYKCEECGFEGFQQFIKNLRKFAKIHYFLI